MGEENVRKLNTEPLAGYLVHGSNGEFCYLDTRERLEMVKTVKNICGSGKLLLAGSGAESTIETVRMTEAMAAAGADVAVVVPPSCWPPSTWAPWAGFAPWPTSCQAPCVSWCLCSRRGDTRRPGPSSTDSSLPTEP